MREVRGGGDREGGTWNQWNGTPVCRLDDLYSADTWTLRTHEHYPYSRMPLTPTRTLSVSVTHTGD
jgi:hypothetical protein